MARSRSRINVTNDRSKGDPDEGSRLPRSRRSSLGERRRSDHRGADGRRRPNRLVDDLRYRPAHPQGRRARGDARHDPRPRSGRHRRREGRRGDDAVRGRSRPRLVHHGLRPVPVLQRGPLRALRRWRRLDLRPPDRRPAGGIRSRAVRRHVRLQGAGGTVRRAGALPRRHPADRVRGRNPERTRGARRHRRRRRRRPDRARDDHDGEAATRPARSSPSTSPTLASRRRWTSGPTWS